MNRKISSALLAMLLLAFVLGCSSVSDLANRVVTTTPQTNSNQAIVQNSNKTLADQAAETVFGNEKTGISECDEVLAIIEQQMQSEGEETFADRAKREVVRQLFFSKTREGLANMSPKEKA